MERFSETRFDEQTYNVTKWGKFYIIGADENSEGLVDFVYFDYVEEESLSVQVNVAKHPLGDSSTVSDNFVRTNDSFKVTASVMGAPTPQLQEFAIRVTQKAEENGYARFLPPGARLLISPPPSPERNLSAVGFSRADTVKEALDRLVGQLVYVYTSNNTSGLVAGGTQISDNTYTITSYQDSRGRGSSDEAVFSLVLERVYIGSFERTLIPAIPPAKRQAKPERVICGKDPIDDLFDTITNLGGEESFQFRDQNRTSQESPEQAGKALENSGFGTTIYPDSDFAQRERKSQEAYKRRYGDF